MTEPQRVGDGPLDEAVGTLKRRAATMQEKAPLRVGPSPAEVAADEARQRLMRRDGEWHDRCPPRFHDAALATVESEPIRSWVAGALDGAATNLLIGGPVGVGKTYAALAAVRAVAEAVHERPPYDPLEWLFTTALRLFRALRPEGEPGAFRTLAAARVLVLDDLGSERPTEWTRQELHALVDERWLYRRPIIATTNLSPEALQEVLGEGTYSRLLEDCETVELDGPDRRRRP